MEGWGFPAVVWVRGYCYLRYVLRCTGNKPEGKTRVYRYVCGGVFVNMQKCVGKS